MSRKIYTKPSVMESSMELGITPKKWLCFSQRPHTSSKSYESIVIADNKDYKTFESSSFSDETFN